MASSSFYALVGNEQLETNAVKLPCLVAWFSNLTLSGLQTIDGVALVAGDRVLVAGQTEATQNGIYDVAVGAWQRSSDFTSNQAIVRGTLVYAYSGALNGRRIFALETASSPVTVGASALVFAETMLEEFAGLNSDNTFTGTNVFTGPVTANSINKVTITAPATSATLTIANGKTLTASNTLTFTGTDGKSFAFPAFSGAVATRTVKHLKADFGVVADGTTSDLAAYNLAAAYANDNGGNTTFIVPVGKTLLDGAPTPIVVGNVFLHGEGAPENCVIKTTANQGLQWGTTSVEVDGGGLSNVGLDSDGNVSRVSLVMPNSVRMTFNNINLLSGVAQLAQLGDAGAGTRASSISFNNLHGIVANVATPLISALKGNGLYVNHYDVFVNAAFGSQVSGRHFIGWSQDSWDTAEVNDGIAQIFDAPIIISVGSGKVIQSIAVRRAYFDQNLQGFSTNVVAGGVCYALESYDNEITARGSGGIGFNATGVGTHLDYRVHRCRILQNNFEGISIPATASIVDLKENHIYAVNQAVGAHPGIVVASGAANVSIVGNNVGADLSSVGLTGLPTVGISVGNLTGALIENNTANGTTSGFSFGTLTSSKVLGNIGATSGVADTSGADRGVALTKSDDTNVTLTLSGSPATALLSAAAIAVGWSGQLSVARGGTGLASGTSGGVLGFTASGALASSGALTANAIMVGGGAGATPNTPATTPPTVSSVGVVAVANGSTPAYTTALGTGGSVNIAGGISVAKVINGAQVTGIADINGISNWQVAACGATDPNKQVWFGFDTTNNRGFMQSIWQGAGYKPLLINPNGGNVVIGSVGDGAAILDVTGTFVFNGKLSGDTSRVTASLPVKLANYTVAGLPAGTAGDTAFATNCRVFNGGGTQEGAGVGTGGLVTHNGTAWKIAGTNVTAVA